MAGVHEPQHKRIYLVLRFGLTGHRAGEGSGGDHPPQAAQDRRLDPRDGAPGLDLAFLGLSLEYLFRRIARRLGAAERLHSAPV